LVEIYNDAHTFGIISANSVAASNAKLAISWLEAAFPELQNQDTEADSLSLLRAHAYSLFDASLVLQVYIYSKQIVPLVAVLHNMIFCMFLNM